jgi:putative heme-binding domain-containing protein
MPRRFCYTLCIAVIGIAIGTSIAQDKTNSRSGSTGSFIASSNNVSNSQITNVPVGNSATFSVTANGTAPLSYQWYLGSNTVADTNQPLGQTNGTIVLTSVELTNAGQAITTNASIGSEIIDELEPGRGLFTKHCAVCHGPHGEGGRGPTLAQPTLPRAGDDASLYRIIVEGLKGTQMPGVHLEGEETAHVAKYVRYLGTRPPEVVPGDPTRGARIYANKGGCVQCHAIHGEGGGFGPDLSAVGLRRSAEYLRRALVDPNAEVPQSYSPWRADVSLPENFLFVRLITKDGQELSGVRINEDTFSIQIREATGAIRSFFKSELSELHKEFGKSPMPTYADALSSAELNDLVAYLASLRNQK